MIAYWSLYFAPLACFIALFRADRTVRNAAFAALTAFIVVLVGWRHEVGCDWFNYIGHYNIIGEIGLAEAVTRFDPGHAILNWFAYENGLGIHFVNAVCALIFGAGLAAFAIRQPYPFLFLVLAAGYLVPVVAMGYTRQATALGFLMLALNAFTDKKRLQFVIFAVLAGTFHKSAFLFLPLVALIGQNAMSTPRLVIAGAFGLVAVYGTLDYIEVFADRYLESGMDSAGGLIRVSLTLLAVLVFFLFKRHYDQLYSDTDLFFIFAVLSLAFLPLALLSTTAVDRIALYTLPWQIAVFTRLPEVVSGTVLKLPAQLAVVGVYGAMLAIWLKYSTHAPLCWLPYQSVLWGA